MYFSIWVSLAEVCCIERYIFDILVRFVLFFSHEIHEGASSGGASKTERAGRVKELEFKLNKRMLMHKLTK